MSEFDNFSPINTHQLYIESPVIPRLGSDDLMRRIDHLHADGYESIGGVIVRSWDISVKAALRMYEKSHQHLQNGGLVGPYVMSHSLLLPGVMVYTKRV